MAKAWKEKYTVQGAEMELVEHLDELRDRVIWCLAALFFGFVLVGIPLNGHFLALLEAPFDRWGPTTAEPQFLELEVTADKQLRLSGEIPPPLLVTPAEIAADDETTTATLANGALRIRDTTGAILFESRPLHRDSLHYFSPVEPFVIRIKIAVLLGFIAALPVLLWHIWRFVAPGLLVPERTFLGRGLMSALILFPAGVAFAYFFLGYALYFLLGYGSEFTPSINLTSYVNLALMLMLAMGIVFEFPLVLLLLLRLEIIERATLERNRPLVLAILLVVSAVITPPDPFTMMMVATPLYLLFEGSLIVARSMRIGNSPTLAAPHSGETA